MKIYAISPAYEDDFPPLIIRVEDGAVMWSGSDGLYDLSPGDYRFETVQGIRLGFRVGEGVVAGPAVDRGWGFVPRPGDRP